MLLMLFHVKTQKQYLIQSSTLSDYIPPCYTPQAFIGMIVLPIAGNACEHVAAIVVAMKNKMELSLGIAIGSSLQISLCVMPFVVLVGWATGHAVSRELKFA